MGDKASLVRGAFLFCLSHTGNMTIAAEFAGASRTQIIAMMRQDAAFQQASEQAMREAEERVFFVAMERAIKGVKVPRFYQGAIIGYVPIPSDMLLRYLLERLRVCDLSSDADETDTSPGEVRDTEHITARLKAKMKEWLDEGA